MSDPIIGLIGVLIGVLSTLVVQRVALRQKAHELFLISLEHLGGGSQERNLGIAALERYWNEYKREQTLIVPLLVGVATYLLTESRQGDAQHERYNLKRIMSLLLDKYLTSSSVTDDPSEVEWFRDLHKALCEWIPDGREITVVKETTIIGDKTTVKKETFTRGLIVEQELVDAWKGKLEEVLPVLACRT